MHMNQQGPREKLLAFGPEALTDAELLAIFIRTGTTEQPVLQLAETLLAEHQSLRYLLATPLHQFTKTKGLGKVKYAQLQAALELGQRYVAETLAKQDVLKNPKATKDYLKTRLCQHQQEVFAAIFLNSQNQVLAFEELFYGSIHCTQIHPRVLVKKALYHNAAAVIVAHNHPSGHAEPSDADLQATIQLKKALALVDIKLLDHFIIGDKVLSLVESGML